MLLGIEPLGIEPLGGEAPAAPPAGGVTAQLVSGGEARIYDLADALVATPYSLPRGLGGVAGAVANVGTNTVAHLGGELAFRHTGTSGANYTVLGAPVPQVVNCWVLVVRFRVDALGVTTTIANTSNQTTGASTYVLHLRVSTTGSLQFVARDSLTRFSSAAGAVQAGRWHTAVIRMGRFPAEQTGNISMRGWLDGQQVGAFVSSSSSVTELTGEVAVASAKHLSATDGQNCAVSFAAFLPKSAPDHVCAALSADPWLLVRPANDDAFVVDASGGPAADLESDATGSGSAAGDITTAIQLVGAAVATGAAAGDLATAVQLAGAAAAAAGASGALSTGIPLAGAAASVTLSGGALTTVIRLDGAALAAALASGTLDSGSAALTGDAHAAGAAAGGLATIIVLQGAAVGGALAAADLTAPGAGLAGAATAGALASASLTTQIPLAGGAQATVIASGEASTSISLAGAAVGVVSATGDLVIALGLSADAVAAALAGASLTTSVTLRADAVAGAQAGGSLAGVIYIASARRTARVAARVRVAAVARRVRTQRVGVFA